MIFLWLVFETKSNGHRGYSNEDQVESSCKIRIFAGSRKRIKAMWTSSFISYLDINGKYCRFCTVTDGAILSTRTIAMELFAEPCDPSHRLSKFFYHETDLCKLTVFDIIMWIYAHCFLDSDGKRAFANTDHFRESLHQHLRYSVNLIKSIPSRLGFDWITVLSPSWTSTVCVNAVNSIGKEDFTECIVIRMLHWGR